MAGALHKLYRRGGHGSYLGQNVPSDDFGDQTIFQKALKAYPASLAGNGHSQFCACRAPVGMHAKAAVTS